MKVKVRDFAIACHGDSNHGVHSHVLHLDKVAKIARKYGKTAEIVAYLHDVVDDAEVSVDFIEERYGRLVADAVSILSDEAGINRAERKYRTYEKMAKVSGDLELALVVKAADRLVNIRSCVADKNDDLLSVYRNEYPVFKKSVFRPNSCDEIWSELDYLCSA